MVKRSLFVFPTGIAYLSFLLFLGSCKKINEATELGGKLVPAVDNVHTFEVSLNTATQNRLLSDTDYVLYSDLVAVGDLFDPEFGHTHANIDFNISPSTIGTYPFVKTDSLTIDSVVLSLSYIAAYGDTLNNGIQTVHVYEIEQHTGFNDSSLYRYIDPATDFSTTGVELGSGTYTIRSLEDTTMLTRGTDTSYVNNVVRIKLDNALGQRFAQYDTSNGYKSDSLFRSLFAGLSIKADPGSNSLTYFNLTNTTDTKLTVYFRYGLHDTLSFDYVHAANGQSNFVDRQPGGNYLSYLNNGAGDLIYLQSAPGSYVAVTIPGLDTFSNKIIHRAEILAEKVPSISDDIFSAPVQMMLDRKNKLTPDTIFTLSNDLVTDITGNVGFPAFGGRLLSDNTVRFDISRYVQSIITQHAPNDTLRIYAPFRTTVFSPGLNSLISIKALSAVAQGRIVLAGGNYADPTKRLRLRIIYSNL